MRLGNAFPAILDTPNCKTFSGIAPNYDGVSLVSLKYKLDICTNMPQQKLWVRHWYIYIHIYMIYMYINICVCVSVCVCVCVCVYIVYTYMCICIYICIHIYMYICMYTYICIHAYIYLPIYTVFPLNARPQISTVALGIHIEISASL